MLISEGNSQTDTGGKELHNLRIGDVLSSNNQLLLTEGGYVGLVHGSGQTLELTEPGKYLISELHNTFNGKNVLATKYLNILWDKVYTRLITARNDKIEGKPLQPDTTKLHIIGVKEKRLNPVYNPTTSINWLDDDASDGRYIVNLMNLYDEVMISEMVTESMYVIDFNDERLTSNDVYAGNKIVSFVVYDADNQDIKSERCGITPVKVSDAETVKFEVQFYEDVLSPISLVDKLIIATYYEDKGLLLDALMVYESLIHEDPAIESFQLLHESFVNRNVSRTQNRGFLSVGLD